MNIPHIPDASPPAAGLGAAGGFERLHYLLESFFDGEDDVNPSFIRQFESWQSWETNPLYSLLHEAIYCQVGLLGGRREGQEFIGGGSGLQVRIAWIL
jgi:hypothetical protein